MDWQTLLATINDIKDKFNKSYKCLSQNRATQEATTNKHTTILVDCFNQARSLIHEQRGRLDKKQWTRLSKFLIKLRTNLINIRENYNLNISIPTILNSPLTLRKEASGSLNDSDSEAEIKEEDLSDLTIPAILKLPEKSEHIKDQVKESIKMTDDTAAKRHYVKEVSIAVPEFDGQKIHLQRFIMAINLVNLTKGSFEDIAVQVIKTKLIGTTLNLVLNETTIEGIVNKLQTSIVGETSQNIKAKLSTVQQKGKTATQFTTEVDNLRKLLEASYIDEGLPSEHANRISTRDAIEIMIKKAEHESVKTVLEAGTCTTMDAAIGAYIRTSARVTGNVNHVMYSKRGNFNRGQGYRGNGRGRGYGHYNNRYNNNNGNNGNQNNGNRGRGNSYRGSRNNQNHNNNGNVRVTQNNSGNSQQPSDTQQ